jgi:hypothetical protein
LKLLQRLKYYYPVNTFMSTITDVVTLTATLTASTTPIPNETITFSYAPTGVTPQTSIGSAVTNASGVATITVTVPAPVAYDFTATFAGDTSYKTSTVEQTNISILAATTIALTVAS